jgi:hypothetical protein
LDLCVRYRGQCKDLGPQQPKYHYVNKLAAAAGVNVEAVRYYHRRDLLSSTMLDKLADGKEVEFDFAKQGKGYVITSVK